jgi:hypothetical protein
MLVKYCEFFSVAPNRCPSIASPIPLSNTRPGHQQNPPQADMSMIEKTQNKSSNTSGAPPKAAFDFEDIMAGMAKKLMVSEKFVPSEFKVISAFTEEVDLDKVEVITAKDGVVFF